MVSGHTHDARGPLRLGDDGPVGVKHAPHLVCVLRLPFGAHVHLVPVEGVGKGTDDGSTVRGECPVFLCLMCMDSAVHGARVVTHPFH